MKVRQRPYHQTQAAHHEDSFLQPTTLGEQRHRCHRDGNLKQGRSLGPAMMLVHLRFALLVEFDRLLLELLGRQLDLGLLGRVALRFDLEQRLARVIDKLQSKFAQILLVALRLVEVPLIRRFGLLDRRIVLEQAASACVAPAMYEEIDPTVARMAVITASWPAMPLGSRSAASSRWSSWAPRTSNSSGICCSCYARRLCNWFWCTAPCTLRPAATVSNAIRRSFAHVRGTG